MFHFLARRLPGNILLLLILFGSMIYYYSPVHRLPHVHFDSDDWAQYLNRSVQQPIQSPTSIIHFKSPECIPSTKSITTTAIRLVTSMQQVITTTTTTELHTATPSCPAPKIPEIDSTQYHTSSQKITREQEIIAKLRDEGIIIIFKTGAQEVSQLAIQVGTTLRYLDSRDILFFSDAQGSIGPFLINDALRNVDQNLKNSDPDFAIYRDIRRYQTTGQDILELQEEKKKGDGRSGWKLDKYKFIHMVEETFEMRPDARWYVFIETDSYVFWDNLAEWLSKLDSRKPFYIGSSVVIGDTAFAHGGSGYVLSNAAMNKLLGPEQPQGLAASWDTKMKGVCCGDLALGIALKEKGVEISVAHPLLNGYKPTTFTYGPNNHWCQAVVTMHHILPHEISSVWRYERRRELLLESPNATMFSDLYFQFVEPHLTESRDNWDNLSHGTEYSLAKHLEVEARRKVKEEAKTKQLAAELKAKQVEEGRKADAEKQKAEAQRQKADAEKQKLEAQKHKADTKKQKLIAEAESQRQRIEAERKFKELHNLTSPTDLEEPLETPLLKVAQLSPNTPLKSAGPARPRDIPTNPRRLEKRQDENEVQTEEEKREEEEQRKFDEEEIKKEEEDEGKTDEELKIEGKKKEDEEKKKAEQEEAQTKKKQDDAPIKQTPEQVAARKKQVEEAQRKKKEQDERNQREDDTEAKYSPAEKIAHESFENCRNVCEEKKDCFQFVFYDNKCKLGMSFRLGKYMPPNDSGEVAWKSGWMVKRIRKWTEENPCKQTQWLLL